MRRSVTCAGAPAPDRAGLYRPEEITRTPYPVYHPDTGQYLYTTYSTVGRRRGLTWEYQFIPLAIRAQAAGKLMQLESLDPNGKFAWYTIPTDHPLTPLQQAIEQEVGKHSEQGQGAMCCSCRRTRLCPSKRARPRCSHRCPSTLSWCSASATATCTVRPAREVTSVSAWVSGAKTASPTAVSSPDKFISALLLMLCSLIRRLLAFTLLLPAACGQPSSSAKRMSPYQTKKFVLTAGPCAADGYWVTIQGGAFIGSDGSAFAVSSGHTLQGDWGASGTTWSSGDDRHPAPERLRLTWFSYAEDKFYKGDFLLPQERIYHLLQQGSWDIEKNKHVTFTTLTVCVLPIGVVVVWLTGGNQVLIGRYQG